MIRKRTDQPRKAIKAMTIIITPAAFFVVLWVIVFVWLKPLDQVLPEDLVTRTFSSILNIQQSGAEEVQARKAGTV